MPSPSPYWFTAKSSGLGWGVPTSWQGVVVLVAFFALFIAGNILIPPTAHPLWFTVYTSALVAALLIICKRKGEPLPPLRQDDQSHQR